MKSRELAKWGRAPTNKDVPFSTDWSIGQELVSSTVRALALALATSVAIAVVTVAALQWTQGESLRKAANATAPLQVRSLRYAAGADSWNAMFLAYRAQAQGSSAPLYSVFFDGKTKFQYPPTALLFFDLLPASALSDPEAMEPGSRVRETLDRLSRIAVFLTVVFSSLCLKEAAVRCVGNGAFSSRTLLALAALTSTLGLTFYPLIRGYQLGQIQVLIDCVIALAALLLLRGNNLGAGLCIGLCCLIKPQYAVIFAWGLWKREWRLILGVLAVAGPALGISLFRYGFTNHLDYVRVLGTLSRHGEAFWANQSVNGVLQRALGNGDPLRFDSNGFPPYHPIIHGVTLVTSLGLLAYAFWVTRTQLRNSVQRTIGVAIVITAATVGSPIAWEHHYGALLPPLFLALPLLLKTEALGRATLPLWILAYCAIAALFGRPDLVFSASVLNPLGMHIFAGGLLLLFLLSLLARRARNGSCT